MLIEELRKAIRDGIAVEYTLHCQKRMAERSITRQDILNCIMHGEIIEDYPIEPTNSSELSFPACLILWVSIQPTGVLHVVVGYNNNKMIIISAYHPDLEHWENDWKTRKEK